MKRFRSIAIVTALAVGLIATAVCFISINQLLAQNRAAEASVTHTVDVLNAATKLDTDLAIVVNQGHLFVIDKGEGEGGIAPFDAAAGKVADDIHGLRRLTLDNPVQQATIDRIEPLIVARIALLREFNERLETGWVDNPDGAIGMSLANAALMEQIYVAAEELKVEERHLLGERQDAAHRATALLVNYLVGYAVLTAATGFLMTALLIGRGRERHLNATNIDLKRLSRHLARARTAADQANRAKSRFLAGMSHELRTPLNGVLGYAQLLNIEGGLNPVQRTRVDAMLGAGKHLLEMITCVLDLSEIEAEHLLLRPVSLDLRKIGVACLDLVRPMADAKGLRLSIAVAPGTSSEFVADPTRLRQILLNLLGNAAKFTSQGAVELRFHTLMDGSALRTEVTDTGPGIDKDLRQRLFQDFERLDSDTAGAVEGAGLGLALSARLARLMGGSLGYDDKPGGGSVFWLDLPLNAIAVASSDVPSDPDAPVIITPQPHRHVHALVVDDIVMNSDIAAAFLRSAGHTVLCVDNGADAVEAVAATDFDVVLMDVRMPGMDGLEATRRIRALGGVRGQVAVVALTAQSFNEQLAECRKAGMDDHLTKPFDPESLLTVVAQAAAKERPAPESLIARMSDHPPAAAAVPNVCPPDTAADILVVDRAAFARTTGFLSSATVESHLQTIVELGDGLLQRLRVPNAVELTGDTLAEAAHALAGSAGLFGFERLANAGRDFELAVQSNSTHAPALADRLVAALDATVAVIQDLGPDGLQDEGRSLQRFG